MSFFPHENSVLASLDSSFSRSLSLVISTPSAAIVLLWVIVGALSHIASLLSILLWVFMICFLYILYLPEHWKGCVNHSLFLFSSIYFIHLLLYLYFIYIVRGNWCAYGASTQSDRLDGRLFGTGMTEHCSILYLTSPTIDNNKRARNLVIIRQNRWKLE